MSERRKKIERIIEQESPSINEVLDAGIKHGLAPLAEELRDPATPLRIKIAVIKAFVHIMKHILFADHKVAAELQEQVEAEVAALKARASVVAGVYKLISGGVLRDAAIHLARKGDPELAEQVAAEMGRGQRKAAAVRAEVAAQIEQLLARRDS